MKFFRLVCVLAMLTYIALSDDHCSTFEQLNPKRNYIPVITGEQIASWLVPDSSGQKIEWSEFGVIEWPQKKNSFVVLGNRILRKFEKPFNVLIGRELYVGVIERTNDHPNNFKLRAHLNKPLRLDSALSASVIGPDFANYRLNDEETSFGIRICYYWGGLRYSAQNKEDITLFRLNKNELTPVLTTPTRWYALEQQDGAPFREADFVAFLKVENSKTLGFYDWTKRSKGKSSQRFRWNGSAYKSSEPEIIKNALEYLSGK